MNTNSDILDLASLAALIPPILCPNNQVATAQLESLFRQLGDREDERRQLADVLHARLAVLPDPVLALNRLEMIITHTAARTLFSDGRLSQFLDLVAFSPAFGRLLQQRPEKIAQLLPVVRETVDAFAARLPSVVPDDDHAETFIRRTKYEEFIRIALADWLGIDSFEETTHKISLVADVCVQMACRAANLDSRVTVIAMGKWGGLELNYSSDIDLLFVADEINNIDLYEVQRQAARVVRLLDAVTASGFVFRVDNRLRPEGRAGALVRTLKQYLSHYADNAMGWEFQALIKARFAAGSEALADQFVRLTRPLVYDTKVPAEDVLVQVRDMKQKIEASLRDRRTERSNVKLGAGGIRDIEFIIQFLQLHHGRVNVNLREAGSLTAIERMFSDRIITAEERQLMRDEYIFLRRLEHCLQITDERPVRQLPEDARDLAVLARKMKIYDSDAQAAAEQLATRYNRAIARTRELFNDFFDMTIGFLEKKKRVRELCPNVAAAVLDGHFLRLESEYFLSFSADDIARHVRMAARLDADHLVDLCMHWVGGGLREITIVGFDYRGSFAKICGLFAAYHQDIVSGESFTYGDMPDDINRASTHRFYRRQRRRHDHRPDTHRNTLDARKMVCVARVQFSARRRNQPISWYDYRDELEGLLRLLKEERFDEASEKLSLRVVSAMAEERPLDPHKALPPIDFHVDNESDRNYTILSIESVDAFMFLFEFTNALATRNYYIGKVEISTIEGRVRDRLFICSGNGKKIVDETRLRDLQLTLTLMKQFARFLPLAPNPQQALKQFSDLTDRIRSASADKAVPIIEQGDTMADLARMLGASTFLWQDFLRMQYENLSPLLTGAESLDRSHTIDALRDRLKRHLCAYPEHIDQVACLNRFKDREMFRIDMRHLTRRVEHFTDFCRELSELTDVVMGAAYRLAIEAAEARTGRTEPGESCLCALGKWGGREMGYGSDVELMLLWQADDGDRHMAVEFYAIVARRIGKYIQSKQDGIFELDFRLRPGGSNSPLATPFERFIRYFSADGGADPYQRQALIRLRPVAGSADLMTATAAHRVSYVFGPEPFDRARILHLRHRQITELVRAGTTNAKFSPGGLVDVEYSIQVLQIRHGAGDVRMQSTNTLEAAAALRDGGVLTSEQYQVFDDGHRFLRAVINSLRIVRGNAKDLVIPKPGSTEFHYFTRRLHNFGHLDDAATAYETIAEKMATLHDSYQAVMGGAPSSAQ